MVLEEVVLAAVEFLAQMVLLELILGEQALEQVDKMEV
jgi:hypothetical protein